MGPRGLRHPRHALVPPERKLCKRNLQQCLKHCRCLIQCHPPPVRPHARFLARCRFAEHPVPAPGLEKRRYRHLQLVRQAQARHGCSSTRCYSLRHLAILPTRHVCMLPAYPPPSTTQACTACGAFPLPPAPPPTWRLPRPPPATPQPHSARWWPPRMVSSPGEALPAVQPAALPVSVRQ